LICPTEGVVTVQAVEPSAQRAYRQLGFVPIDVSDGDWVDEEMFRPLPGTVKRYDAIMVSNFIPWKRHEFLFRAMRDHGLGDRRVALVASSHVGLGVDWARRLLASYGLLDNVEMFVDISQERVNELLNASRCHVLCSLREGANRSCLEALFAGIPVLIDARHIGFPHWRFPASVVRTFSDEAALADELRRVRGETAGHDISSIAGSLAGARVATAKLEEALRVETEARGESWTAGLTPKVTRVHCCYRTATDFDQHAGDYEFLQTVTSGGFAYDPERARTLLTR
jgi:glycosyltransferase involved in cell wall biosynthesis